VKSRNDKLELPRSCKQENLIDERWLKKEEGSRWFPFFTSFYFKAKVVGLCVKKNRSGLI
jgi:hypothetical protein